MKFSEVPHIFLEGTQNPLGERYCIFSGNANYFFSGNAIFFGGNAKSFGGNGVPTRSHPL